MVFSLHIPQLSHISNKEANICRSGRNSRGANPKIGLAYESQPKHATAAFFTTAQGAKDAADALTVIRGLGVRATVPVFFCVDIDPNPNGEIPNIVAGYLAAAHAAFSANSVPWEFTAQAHYALPLRPRVWWQFTWLSKSTKYYGYNDWLRKADITQDPHESLVLLNADVDHVINLATLW